MTPRISAIMIVVVLLCLIFYSNITFAAPPGVMITEKFEQVYNRGGSVQSTPTNTGNVNISMPNTNDVLQYIRMNLSAERTRTNMDNNYVDLDGKIWMLYRGTAPDNTKLFFNSSGTDASSYTLDSSGRTQLDMSATIKNYAGGTDYYNNDNLYDNNGGSQNSSVNIFNITLTITNPSGSWQNVTNAAINVTFNRGTNGARDILNITTATAIGCTGLNWTDADTGDGDQEKLTCWNATLNSGNSIVIDITAQMETGKNIADATTSAGLNNTDMVEARHWNSSSTGLSSTKMLSGMTIAKKFARGPSQQGVNLMQESTGGDASWRVRGIFKNTAAASGLTYTVNQWRLYQITAATGAPNTSASLTDTTPESFFQNISGGTTVRTDIYDTSDNSSKPYYGAYFDWEVDFGGAEGYTTLLRGILDLADIYMVDFAGTKAISGILLPETNNQSITITDTLTYLGSNSAKGSNITLNSFVPSYATDSGGNLRNVSTWINGSSVVVKVQGTTVTSGMTTTIVNSTPGNAGYVQIYISNISATNIGSDLSTNQQLTLAYGVVFNDTWSGSYSFNFTANATLKSVSQTPDEEIFSDVKINSSRKRLQAFKDVWSPSASDPNLIHVVVNITAMDRSAAQDGIAGIWITDYIPSGTNFSVATVNMSVYNTSGQIARLVSGTSVNVTTLGTTTLSDGTTNVTAISYGRINQSSGIFWNGTLYDNWTFYLNYSFRIFDTGLYTLPTQIVGLDPQTGKELFAGAIGFIYVNVPGNLTAVQIEDGELTLAKNVIVGKPAVWSKTFTAYNPNTAAVTATFKTKVFSDILNVYISYINERGERVEETVEHDGDELFWESKLAPLETRHYEITVTTSPILEIDRSVEVLKKLENKRVKLKMDIFLKSFAKETYTNIVMGMPIGYEKVENVVGAFGNALAFTGGADSIRITIPDMEPEGIRTVTIIYVESYPTIIVTPGRERYDAGSQAALTVLVINGGERIVNPYLETEVYDPEYDLIYTKITESGELKPLEKTENTEEFEIPASALTGNYLANVRFRENFVSVSEGAATFYVLGATTSLKTFEIFILFMVTVGLLYVSYRRGKMIKQGYNLK